MHFDPEHFLDQIAPVLSGLYALAAGVNGLAAIGAWRQQKRRGWAWLGLFLLFASCSGLALAGRPPGLPEGVRAALDAVIGPVVFMLGTLAFLTVLYLGRSFFVRSAVAWTGLNAALLWLGLSMTDVDFAAVVAKPDNVPIVAMVFLLGFFTWLGAAQAVANDRRIEAGQPPVEKQFGQTTLVWPDLVYIELIAMVLLTTGLTVWSLALPAPLEQPANPAVTPNPSKAPWYFLGLQEMLVFFDPSMAGVILPLLIILGLMAIPYLDRNPAGSGYYSIRQRRFAYLVFHFGFLQLWILLILVGTFMRGPNWSFFGLYEPRDPYKIDTLANVRLSEAFWTLGLGRSVPEAPSGAGALAEFGYILWREMAGVAVLAAYFVGLPLLLGRTLLRNFRLRMGRGRYWIMALLLMMMLALPLKMLLRWSFGLSYLLAMPEYYFNF